MFIPGIIRRLVETALDSGTGCRDLQCIVRVVESCRQDVSGNFWISQLSSSSQKRHSRQGCACVQAEEALQQHVTSTGRTVTVSVPTLTNPHTGSSNTRSRGPGPRSRLWIKLLESRGVSRGVVTKKSQERERIVAKACTEHRERVVLSTVISTWRHWVKGAQPGSCAVAKQHV
jgi:hypothetical protein